MQLSDNARASFLMMSAMAAFTLNDTFMKLLSTELPLFQALFLRGIGSTLGFLVIAPMMGGWGGTVPRRDRVLIAVRTVAEIGAAYFFLTALFNMPLANVSAILQALPLTVTLAAVVFLGEPAGWRRMTAILVGFVGVMLIVRPGPEGFNTYGLMALASVGCVTLRDLATRRLSVAVPSVVVALAAAVGVMVFFGIASIWDSWAVPSTAGALQLGGATVFVIAGYMMSVGAMRLGDLGFVAPFRYMGLLWALVLGYVIFGDWPDPVTLLGAGIIVATGMFTLYRENRAAKRASRG